MSSCKLADNRKMENLEKKIQGAINLYRDRKFLEAEQLAKKLLNLNPKVSFLYNLLGLILAAQSRNDEAIKYYEKGIEIKPKYAMIYNNLGTVYKTKKNYLKAENYYNKSIELDKKLPEAQNNLGSLYVELNKLTEAISSFKKSISINSNFYIAHYNLGVLYKSIGKFKESRKYFDETIRLYPKFYNVHRALSQISKYKINDKHIDLMKKLYEESGIDIYGKMELAFALGKAFDDIKNFDDAFRYYNEGNNIRRNNIKFFLNAEKNEFLNIKKTFDRSFFNKYQKIGKKDPTPIFILGMPRSGTTLVEQIISNHPKVYGGGELNFFNDLIKSYFYKNENFSIESNNKIIENNFKTIGQVYINKIKKMSGGNERVTDKLPINFKWIGFIKLILPNSKIIHCTRNAKDTCASIYKNYFTSAELNYAYNLKELIDFYNLYLDLMEFWKKNIPGFIIEVKYENLINSPKKEISKLIKNCNLNWNENCVKFYNNQRAIKTASDTQVRNKIYTSSIDSWKNYKKYLKEDFAKLKS